MSDTVANGTRELAFYYPNPMWYHAIVAGLKQHGLLEIIEPEQAVDKSATEKLATEMTDVITSAVLDDLAKEKTAFHELSMSRLGYYGDEEL